MIGSDCRSAFEFIADLRNDWRWRTEVRTTVLDGEVRLGAVAVEASYLSKKMPAYLRKLVCSSYTPGQTVAYQTEPANLHYLKTTRWAVSHGPNLSQLTYRLEFDPSIVRFSLGYPVPRLIIHYVTRRAMKAYLRNLKRILEQQPGGCSH
ncbi:SRPBCC family protein [Pedobacter deserti]|uniref:SRPBCC family protein n=1 Tax=Pedobacter deserti TaxID=2817382 RepID=UPI00210EA80A|nr:SRPBCC family protein [Pedobacter sp. SYSU D00382]